MGEAEGGEEKKEIIIIMRLGDRFFGATLGKLERKMEAGYDHISLNICVELSLEMASKVIHSCPRNVYNCG